MDILAHSCLRQDNVKIVWVDDAKPTYCSSLVISDMVGGEITARIWVRRGFVRRKWAELENSARDISD